MPNPKRIAPPALVLISLLLSTQIAPLSAIAADTEPLDLVPADSLLCWNSTPFPDTDRKADAPSALGTLLEA
ncbi:MAG: hypothetical protein ACKVS9_01800, partial [Phycisphaerae bacterium]